MRCIEIAKEKLHKECLSLINRNMRCIEIKVNPLPVTTLTRINRNMRCIEIDFLAMIQAAYPRLIET